MAQVPYTPVPTAQPADPGERIGIATPGAAFGENIGQAVRGLGSTLGEVGNELFTRAIALQDLQNETEARNKAADYAEQQGKMQADFDSKVGKDAVDSLQPHLSASRQLRGTLRDDLSNPAAQRLYDNFTFNFLERNIYSSARHAGDENRKYIVGGYNATADMAVRGVEDHPNDPNFYQTQVDHAVSAAKQAAMVAHGTFDENDPIVQDAGAKAGQRMLAAKIRGIVRDNPIAAQKLLEDNRDRLGEEYEQLEGIVETKGTAVASSNIVDGIFASHKQPDGTYDATTAQMQQEARDKAKEAFPDNQLLPTRAAQELDTRFRLERFAKDNDRRDALTSVNQALAKNPEVNDVQALLALPGMDKTVAKLDDFDKSTLNERIHKARTTEYHQEWDYNKTRANGLATNDVNAFLGQDFGTWNLDPTERLRLQQKQTQLAQKPTEDPRVSSAMGILSTAFGPQLDAMGVRRQDRSDPNSPYNHFTGALQEAIQTWQEDHKKPPSYDDLVGPIFKELLTKQPTSSFFGLVKGEDFAFKQFQKPLPTEVPPEFRDRITADVVKAGGAAPSADQVYRAYLRTQFIKLYGGTGGGSK